MKTNKKGFLLAEETLKLIIAVIAIGFLVYLLTSLYFSAKTSQKLEQAEETLQFIMSETNAGKTNVDIYNPKGWWLISWPGSIDALPKECSNLGLNSCICLCEKNNAKSCDENGICINNKGFLIEGDSIKIENPPITLNIKYETKKISLEQ